MFLQNSVKWLDEYENKIHLELIFLYGELHVNNLILFISASSFVNLICWRLSLLQCMVSALLSKISRLEKWWWYFLSLFVPLTYVFRVYTFTMLVSLLEFWRQRLIPPAWFFLLSFTLGFGGLFINLSLFP